MDLTKISSSDLKNIGRLLERKEKLLGEVEEIDRTLSAYQGRELATAAISVRKGPRRARKTAPSKRRGKAGKRGARTEAIIAELQFAGKEGITIRDLEAKTGIPYRNLGVWFYTTGKKNKKVKKAGPGRFIWVE